MTIEETTNSKPKESDNSNKNSNGNGNVKADGDNKPTKPKRPKKKKKEVPNSDPFYVKLTPSVKRKLGLALKKSRGIINHIQNVQDNGIILSEKLIELGNIDLGISLLKNIFQHDVSKFTGIEWDNMAPGTPLEASDAKAKLKLAIKHHQRTNKHHVDAWVRGMEEMPDEYLAELACDIKARSEEFGSNLREWIDNEAIKKWDITKEHPQYKKLMYFVNLLCTPPFE